VEADEDVEEVEADDEKDEHNEADDEEDEDEDLVLRLLLLLLIVEFKKDTEVSMREAISDGERFGEGGIVVRLLEPSECVERGDKGEKLDRGFRFLEAFSCRTGGNKAGYSSRILSDGILRSGTNFIIVNLLSGNHSSFKMNRGYQRTSTCRSQLAITRRAMISPLKVQSCALTAY